MPIYFCRWPNGDFSVVSASNREDAVFALDEVGSVDEKTDLWVTEDFMAHFALTDAGNLELQEFGDEAEAEIMRRAYPLLWGALDEFGEDSDENRALVEAERRRLSEEEPQLLKLDSENN